MSQFENVTVKQAANIYFDGKVTSRTVVFADGSEKTLGIMLPGEYEFGTGKPERMAFIAGKLKVLLPGEKDWLVIEGEGAFDVPGDSSFKLVVEEVADYCCSYLD